MSYFSKPEQRQNNGWQNYLKPNGLQPEEKKGFNPSVLKGDWNFTDCRGDTIYSTHDYDKFEFNNSNRPVNPKHVEKLKASYDVKDLNTVIDVTVDGEVTDGQHRFTMFKETGKAVIFRVVFGQTIADVQTLNLNTKKWSVLDFAGYHQAEEKRKVEKGIIEGPGPYTMLMQVLETYKTQKATVDKLLYILYPTDILTNGLRSRAAFKQGLFKITVAQKENLVAKLLQCLEIDTFYNQAFRRNFIRAYCQALDYPRFKHKKFLLRLKQGHNFYDKLSVADYKAQI